VEKIKYSPIILSSDNRFYLYVIPIKVTSLPIQKNHPTHITHIAASLTNLVDFKMSNSGIIYLKP